MLSHVPLYHLIPHRPRIPLTLHLKQHTFLHPVSIIFPQHMSQLSQPVRLHNVFSIHRFDPHFLPQFPTQHSIPQFPTQNSIPQFPSQHSIPQRCTTHPTHHELINIIFFFFFPFLSLFVQMPHFCHTLWKLCFSYNKGVSMWLVSGENVVYCE